MTAEAKRIFERALALPERDRLALIEALAESIAASDPVAIDDTWRAEILRRVAQVRRGEVVLESWDEVRRAGREALAR